jgi:hypothetical protein
MHRDAPGTALLDSRMSSFYTPVPTAAALGVSAAVSQEDRRPPSATRSPRGFLLDERTAPVSRGVAALFRGENPLALPNTRGEMQQPQLREDWRRSPSSERRSSSAIVSPPSPEHVETPFSIHTVSHQGRSGASTPVSAAARHNASRVAVLAKYVEELERERFLLLDEMGRLRRERDEAQRQEQSAHVMRLRAEDRCVFLDSEVGRLLQLLSNTGSTGPANTFRNPDRSSYNYSPGRAQVERSQTPPGPLSTPPRSPPLSSQKPHHVPIMSPAPPAPPSVASAILALSGDIREVKNMLETGAGGAPSPNRSLDDASRLVNGDMRSFLSASSRHTSVAPPPYFGLGVHQKSDAALRPMRDSLASPETIRGSPSPSPPAASVSPPTASLSIPPPATANLHSDNVSTISSPTDDEDDHEAGLSPTGSGPPVSLRYATLQAHHSSAGRVRRHHPQHHHEPLSPPRPRRQSQAPRVPPPGGVVYESSPEDLPASPGRSTADLVIPDSRPLVAASQRFGIAFPLPRR